MTIEALINWSVNGTDKYPRVTLVINGERIFLSSLNVHEANRIAEAVKVKEPKGVGNVL